MSNLGTTVRLNPVDPSNETEISSYNEITSVAAGIETTVLTFTVPSVAKFFLHRIEVTGTNKADFKVKFNGITSARAYSYFTALNYVFDFTAGPNKGYPLDTGDVITITVIHSRPYIGEFSSRIQALQVE